MSVVMNLLGSVMRLCYELLHNYGLAIILFTLLTKIILLPVSIWVQYNSIKIVGMQPEINRLKIKYFGDKETIAEEQEKIYKKAKYNPFASVIPMIIQIALLLGVIGVIYRPMTHILHIGAEAIAALTQAAATALGANPAANSIQLLAVNDIRSGAHAAVYEGLTGVADLPAVLDKINDFKLVFAGVNLSWVPAQVLGATVLIPLVAGASAFLLSVIQNRQNILQAEQSRAGQYGTMAFSVGLSLYLGFFVPAGVALYWICSNLMAIAQVFLLNHFIDPRKHVDMADLEATREELRKMEELGTVQGTKEEQREYKKREKKDYKRFFSVVNKHIVFYSESSGFYKYFAGMIEYLLSHTNLTIHYITSDPKDQIFAMAEKNDKIRAYYIAEKRLITLMMKMDADVVVMTMPDIENYHIKRSYIRKDIEYIYIPHGVGSLNLLMRTGSMDHYDTVFCTGKEQKLEAERTDEVYNIQPRRKLVEWGYSLLDDMRRDYAAMEKKEHARRQILIAPSWQKDNITDLCLEDMLDGLKGCGYQIIVRPHPQQVRHEGERFEAMKRRYENDSDITIQTDFSSNSTVFEADIMISDWSGVAYEYAFTTGKPVLFIDTPMKVMNPEYERIGVEPINIWSRSQLGIAIKPEEVKDRIRASVETLLDQKDAYHDRIEALVQEYVYNLGTSAEVGAKYMVSAIQEKIKAGKKE